MWLLTGKPAPTPLKHKPKPLRTPAASTQQQQQQQQPSQTGDNDAGASSGFKEGFGPLDYSVAAFQHHFSLLPTLNSWSKKQWYEAVLDTVGLQRWVRGQDAALLFVQISQPPLTVVTATSGNNTAAAHLAGDGVCCNLAVCIVGPGEGVTHLAGVCVSVFLGGGGNSKKRRGGVAEHKSRIVAVGPTTQQEACSVWVCQQAPLPFLFSAYLV